MSGWTMPIQQASFKGVRFDVLAVDDSFERAVVEHAYPFVNGADLEDMGLNKQTVRLQAVLFGEGYYADYQAFLAMVQKRGTGVLVHPVRGRMPNMLLLSANLRHDAENVNYVSLDLNFAEASEMQPIFVFENSLLSRIDKFLLQIENFVEKVTAWWAKNMEMVVAAHNVKKRLLSQWSAIFYMGEQLFSLLDFDNSLYDLRLGVTKASFLPQSSDAIGLFFKVFKQAADKYKFSTNLGVKSAFNDLMRDFDAVAKIPRFLETKQTQRITSAAQFFKQRERQNQGSYLSTQFTRSDLQVLTCALQLMSSAILTQSAVQIIEAQAEEMTPADIEYITTQARLSLLKSLNLVRKMQQDSQQNIAINEPNNGLYTAMHELSEVLRDSSHELMQIALSAINQKPPLVVRNVEVSGTLPQVAHAFYGDYSRSDELLRLNPQIRQPNFIERATLLNCYSE
ncbi:Phage virion protein [Mannheimia sp. USDA-ARS-USMARC-1261]|uniref:DNA circularization protein n=1 Tax=Mannheimia sp. USDA-ARS-USMARC-1261 TaxID=1432056 RepID=UPI0003E37812|nr:DNA circularization N-terminal domain-containing protein [Mannheimia sp. USDA-ARS-USMARC-1261]AHG74193.1 Phage virion protein [Mannheimia sp. USDA-ARS-USMARC-1261]